MYDLQETDLENLYTVRISPASTAEQADGIKNFLKDMEKQLPDAKFTNIRLIGKVCEFAQSFLFARNFKQ